MVTIPGSIKADPVQAEIWEQIVPANNRFKPEQLPTLELLVFWHAVAKEAKRVITRGGKMRIITAVGFSGVTDADGNRLPTRGKEPALQVLQDATKMIQTLSESLNLSAAIPSQKATTGNGQILQMVLGDREAKEKAAK